MNLTAQFSLNQLKFFKCFVPLTCLCLSLSFFVLFLSHFAFVCTSVPVALSFSCCCHQPLSAVWMVSAALSSLLFPYKAAFIDSLIPHPALPPPRCDPPALFSTFDLPVEVEHFSSIFEPSFGMPAYSFKNI